MLDYGVKSTKSYRFNLVVADSFSKHGWSISMKNNISRTKTSEVSNNIHKFNREPSLSALDDGKNFANRLFTDFQTLLL